MCGVFEKAIIERWLNHNMDKEKITVIICCAGMGTRLGIGSTKALVNINGKPLIIRILELLKGYSDIRIVVGYQAEKVINVVTQYRKDIMFVFNYDFETNGIVQSFNKAISYAREYVVEIDGDLLINPEDFQKFMDYPDECLGINKINSHNPILINVYKEKVVQIANNYGEYEWTGLLKMKAKNLLHNGNYLYEVLRPVLPIQSINVRARDIDTADDYENAVNWFLKGMKE